MQGRVGQVLYAASHHNHKKITCKRGLKKRVWSPKDKPLVTPVTPWLQGSTPEPRQTHRVALDQLLPVKCKVFNSTLPQVLACQGVRKAEAIVRLLILQKDDLHHWALLQQLTWKKTPISGAQASCTIIFHLWTEIAWQKNVHWLGIVKFWVRLSRF